MEELEVISEIRGEPAFIPRMTSPHVTRIEPVRREARVCLADARAALQPLRWAISMDRQAADTIQDAANRAMWFEMLSMQRARVNIPKFLKKGRSAYLHLGSAWKNGR